MRGSSLTAAGIACALGLPLAVAACRGERPAVEDSREQPARDRSGGVDQGGAPSAEPSVDPETADEPRVAGIDFTDVSYRLLGNEPFWHVEMTRDGLVYERLGEEPIEFPFGRLMRRARADEMTSEAGGHTITALVTRAPCSDGMSDREYDFAARVEIDGEVLEGCALTPVPGPAAETSDPVAEAGLSALVDAARALSDGQSAFDRHVGRLPDDPRAPGLRTDYAAYFEAGTLRMVEARVMENGSIRAESTYYFDTNGALFLVDRDAWAEEDGEHSWLLVGYAVDSEPTDEPRATGVVYEEDREAARSPGTVLREAAGTARRLAQHARANLP